MKPTVLKYKIRIAEPTYSEGEYGQELNPPEQWTTIAIVWATYRDLSGNEFFAARQIQSKLTGEFKIRYRLGLKTSYKIVWGNRVFDITAIRDIDGKKQWLYINAEEQFNG